MHHNKLQLTTQDKPKQHWQGREGEAKEGGEGRSCGKDDGRTTTVNDNDERSWVTVSATVRRRNAHIR